MRAVRILYLLFVAILFGIGVSLYHILPPAPRWTTQLDKDEEVLFVDSVNGRVLAGIKHDWIGVHQNGQRIAFFDLFTGGILERPFSGEDIRIIDGVGISPDHRYCAVCLNNDGKMGLINLRNLDLKVIGLNTENDDTSFTTADFSLQSKWLAVTKYNKGESVSVVYFIDPIEGQIIFKTGRQFSFVKFLEENSLAVCERSLGRTHYAVSLWDLRTGKMVHESPPFRFFERFDKNSWKHYTQQWSSDGRTLIACRDTDNGKPEFIVWDVVHNRTKCSLPKHITEQQYETTLSTDGKTAVFSSRSPPCNLVVFDIENETILANHLLRKGVETKYVNVTTNSIWAGCSPFQINYIVDRLNVKKIRELKEEYYSFVGESNEESPVTIWHSLPSDLDPLIIKCRGEYGESSWSHEGMPTGRRASPKFQLCSKSIFVGSAFHDSSSPFVNYLRQWQPKKVEPTFQLECLELATGRPIGRVQFPEVVEFHFSDEHQVLVTWGGGRDGREMACWDYPFRPAWSSVIGPPLAIALLGFIGFCSVRFVGKLATRHRHCQDMPKKA